MKSVINSTPPQAFREYLTTTTYNIRGFQAYVIKAPRLRQFLWQRTGRGIYLEVNSIEIAKWLESMGLTIVASDSDGSKSSWIISIDPNNRKHVEFLKKWCESRMFLRDFIMNPDIIDRNPELRDVFNTMQALVNDCAGGDADNDEILEKCINDVTGLSIVIDDLFNDNGVIFRVANPKVRLRIDPCRWLNEHS